MQSSRLLILALLLLTCQCAARAASKRNYHAGDERKEIRLEGFDKLMTTKVLRAAKFDLSCPKEEIRVVKLDHGSYGAMGCGRRARYVGRDDVCYDGNTEQRLIVDCVVVMAGAVTESRSAP